MKISASICAIVLILGLNASCEGANYGPYAKSKKQKSAAAKLEKTSAKTAMIAPESIKPEIVEQDLRVNDAASAETTQEVTPPEEHAAVNEPTEKEIESVKTELKENTENQLLPEEQKEDETAPTNTVTQDDVRAQTQLALETAKRFVQQKEAHYHGQIDAKLASFTKRLEQLRLQATLASENAKVKITEELTHVNARVDATHQKLVDLNSSNDQTLSELAKQLDDMIGSIEKSFEQPAAKAEKPNSDDPKPAA